MILIIVIILMIVIIMQMSISASEHVKQLGGGQSLWVGGSKSGPGEVALSWGDAGPSCKKSASSGTKKGKVRAM